MGKSDERGDITIRAGESTFIPKTSSEASKMLEAALLQMDDIISGACIESNNEGTAEWKDSVKEATRNLVTAIKSSPSLPSTPDAASIEILLQWMQPVPGRFATDLAAPSVWCQIPSRVSFQQSLDTKFT
ncbi:uncharacterized protein LOC117224860 [Megalopta genalis]|uniref:uncharacterized protein LOC117224860 n=1 Tax=Megalopta genalis TaxID=115081 RepID=UPI0014430143|nr:uncharacterized protein LOC117224860 [Megalopta genalis]